MNWVILMLAFIGGGVMLTIIVCAIGMFKEWVSENIRFRKLTKKHSKPCTIVCYCKDCMYYRVNHCVRNYAVSENYKLNPYWYCAEGELMNKETFQHLERRKEKYGEEY